MLDELGEGCSETPSIPTVTGRWGLGAEKNSTTLECSGGGGIINVYFEAVSLPRPRMLPLTLFCLILPHA